MFIRFLALFIFASMSCATQAFSAPSEIHLTIQNHQFIPDKIVGPRGEKFKLIVINQDSTPEEFESYELNREKVIPGESQVILYIGPLEPGDYPFFGEFNPDSAKGILTIQ